MRKLLIACFIALGVSSFLIFKPAQAAVSVSPSISSSTQTSSLNQGLVGYWTMDGRDINWNATTSTTTGQMLDRSGQGNMGTLVGLGRATSTAAGKLGQAISLNGREQGFLAIASSTALNSNLSQMTVSAWIMTRNFNNHQRFFTLIPQNGISNQIGIGSSNFIFLHTNIDGIQYNNDIVSYDGFSTNKWYHLAFVYDGVRWNYYLNGTYRASGASHPGNIRTAGNLGLNMLTKIGADSSSSNQGLNGLIDDVRIYNRALAASEVRQLYAQSAQTYAAVSPTPVASTSPAYGASQANSLNQGLVGYWTMDGRDINWNATTSTTTGQMLDRSGQGNMGTLVGLGRATSTTAGKLGQAMKFDGIRSYVKTGNTFNFSDDSEFTVSFWFNSSQSSTVVQELVGKSRATANSWSVWYRGSDGLITFELVGNDAVRRQIMSTGWYPNRWYFVTATYGNRTGKLYVNADYKNQWNYSDAGGFDNIRTLEIGKQSGSLSYFNGSIDDVRIYNRALAASEVRQLYAQSAQTYAAVSPTPVASTSPAYGASQANSLNQGLVGYWTMDGRDINWGSNTMVDRSGNGNTGTLVSLAKGTSTAAGKLGQAVRFDGLMGRVIAANNLAQNGYLNGDTTISVWVNAINFTPIYGGCIVCQSYPHYGIPTETMKGVQLAVDRDGRIHARVYGTAVSSVRAGNVISKNKWYNLVLRIQGSELRLYQDGILVSVPVSITSRTTETKLYIGGENFFNLSWFNGSIDDVRIYNRALAASEVKQLYNLGR